MIGGYAYLCLVLLFPAFTMDKISLPMALSAGFWGRETSWLEDVVLVVRMHCFDCDKIFYELSKTLL